MRNRSCILTYHSLDTSGSVVSVPPDLFRAQMAWLAQSGTPVVSLAEIQKMPGAVALTFDDGFRNFFQHAFPVLQRHGFPATVFVVSGFCGGRNNWPTQPRNTRVPCLELMRWNEVRQVAQAGIAIGCHTVNHPRLPRLAEGEVEEELRASRTEIEDRVGKAVDTFAYPYGETTPAIRRAVEGHFRFACGTRLAFVSGGADALCLPRLDIYYLQNHFWFRGLWKSYGAGYLAVRAWLRRFRRLREEGTAGAGL
jgi:peptidoglycan/xylan/chitin deacetylase (PgdA/CDA1 family)